MYEQTVRDNIAKFKGDEKTMWESVRSVDKLLERMKEHHPDIYWDFMREQHEIMYGKHFDEKYAKWEVEQMLHKSPDGKVYKGEHWSYEDASAVLMKHRHQLPTWITECDFYVAVNAQWHDYACWATNTYGTVEQAENAIVEMAIAYWSKGSSRDIDGAIWDNFQRKK